MCSFLVIKEVDFILDKLNLDFDYELTKEYRYKYESQCTCAYCRNYYKSFKVNYPKTSKLLEEFGLDANFPLEAMPLEYDKLNDEMEYIVYYPIKGSMVEKKHVFLLENLEIKIFKGSNSGNPCPNPKMEEPYLLMELAQVKLLWVLEEELEQ